MNKYIFAFALSLLMTGTLFTGCQSEAQKEQNAEEKLDDAQEDLEEAKDDANTEAEKADNAEEWRVYKNDIEVKISNNELRIAELKVKLKKPGKALDEVYVKRIETLEKKNADLKARLIAYDKDQGDWDSFKREFNHDMDELGKALEDLTKDNTN